ncbi:MAG TPA: vWA domain-containing protein [Polyangiaceae bacterium]|nr:vWA domain-containing protein [Polyangiaceae bacterium]
MKRHYLLGFAPVALALSIGLIAGGCSSKGDDDDDSGSGRGGSGSTTGGTAARTGGTSSMTTGGTVGTNTGGSVGTGKGGTVGTSTGGTSTGKAPSCDGVPFTGTLDPVSGMMCGIDSETEAVAIPVDMYIMMDRSSSMLYTVPNSTETRWAAFEKGMRQFVMEASGQDLRAGIGFFGASVFGGEDAVDCNVDNYATPKVEIGAMADVGPELINAIIDNQPAGLTPTLPALTGAVQHAKEWKASGKNMNRKVVVVLVTDGYPTQCQSPVSITDIAKVAKDAFDNDQIRTYVIGLAAGFNLNTIAQAGGTESATLLDEAEPTSSLVDALTNITDTKVSCEFEIPEPSAGMEIDKDKVRLVWTPQSAAEQEIPRVDNFGNCAVNPNGGWYYDNPANPKRIFVCPCTCSQIGKAGRLRVSVGCSPTFGIR